MSIGQYPQVSLADAAGQTAIIKQGLKENIDPLAEKARLTQKKFNTVDDLAEDWLDDCTKDLSTQKSQGRYIETTYHPQWAHCH